MRTTPKQVILTPPQLQARGAEQVCDAAVLIPHLASTLSACSWGAPALTWIKPAGEGRTSMQGEHFP